MSESVAVHVFMGYGYYPESGLGDYKYSFYGDDATGDAERYVSDFFKDSRCDWYSIIIDQGSGLREFASGWKGLE